MAERDPTGVELFFDCACLWAYFAVAHWQRCPIAADMTLTWRPVRAAAVFSQVDPASRWSVPEIKQRYYRGDAAHWADFLQLPLADDPPEAGDSTACMLACVAAGRWGKLESFARAAMTAAFAQGRDLGDRAVIAAIWRETGLPDRAFDEGLAWPDVAAELHANAIELMDRGGFGVPTFFANDAMYFGNDAVPLVERAASDRLRLGGAGIW
jgi:2-hydroxychromene-2-carboxylate isomerase